MVFIDPRLTGPKAACAALVHLGVGIGQPKRIFDRSEAVRLRTSGLSIERFARQVRLGAGHCQ
jgi:hypothetical protein